MESKKNLEDSVSYVMSLFKEEYRQKFILTNNRHKVWCYLLAEYDPELILSAAIFLIATRKDFPPDIATMRERCDHLANGEFDRPSAEEAWERIRAKCAEVPNTSEEENFERIELTDLEKTALEQVGTLYDLRRSQNPQSDRATFVRSFNRLINKQYIERLTPNSVKKAVQRQNERLLAESPVNTKRRIERHLEASEEDLNIPTGEELKNLIAETKKAMGVDW